nr:chemoattractant P-1=interleukin-8-like chemokine {N-terminal} [rats, kidney, NRK-49F fibroblasts, Peptide Partial, 14 aa] [Rattus sp.]
SELRCQCLTTLPRV